MCRSSLKSAVMVSWFTKRIVVAILIITQIAGSQSFAQTTNGSAGQDSLHSILETFEGGEKGSYVDGEVTLSTGNWYFSDALIGALPTDRKDGGKAVRIEHDGTLAMDFDMPLGAREVSIQHAVFGSDEGSTWQLWYSIDHGGHWSQIGNTVSTSAATLATATFTMHITGTVRFEIRKLGGGRLDIDNFSIISLNEVNERVAPVIIKNSHAGHAVESIGAYDDNLALGNPSKASANPAIRDNYLVVKPQYTLSYNNDKGIPNWVSWHLSNNSLGHTDRCNCFEPDGLLPPDYFKAVTTDYNGSGFDRGHLCPSADRTDNIEDNAITFQMDNITPQAPNLNEITWEHLEDYCRLLAKTGYELYIIAGQYGQSGTGRNGSTAALAGGHICVPAHFWKVVVILPEGDDDVHRIGTGTRVIAVDMPNVQSVSSKPWTYYRTSVDAIEKATGYDLLSNVPLSVQKIIEARVDDGPSN